MPVYNCQHLLHKGINSILSQTYTNWELIIVDDGSTDDSGKRAEEFSIQDDRIKVIHKTNGGPSGARNVGLKAATGEYIYFIDSDDELLPNGLNLMLNEMIKNKTDWVIAGYNIINENAVNKVYLPAINNGNIQSGELFLTLFNKMLINSLWNKLYKKEKIIALFNEDIKWGEDLEFNLNYIKNINSFTLISECVYNYFIYINQNSLTSMSQKRKYEQNLLSIPNRISLIQSIFPRQKEVLSSTCGDFVEVTKNYIRSLVKDSNNYKEIQKELKKVVNCSLLRETLKFYTPKTKNDKVFKFLLKVKFNKFIYKLYKIKLKQSGEK